MRHRLWLVSLVLLGSCSLSFQPLSPTAEAGWLALVGVHVVDVEAGRVLPDQTVLVRGGSIHQIGDRGETAVPSSATVVDAQEKFAFPGLWDMHVHLTDEAALGVYLAHGVVGVRDMAAGMFVEPDEVRTWAREVADGRRHGPRILRAGPLLEGSPSGYAGTLLVKDPADAPAAARQSQDQGADFLKVLGSLSEEAFWALSAEARARKLDLVGHVPRAVGVKASAPAMRSMEHLMGHLLACSSDEEALREAYRALREEPDRESRALRSRELKRRLLDSYDPGKAAELFATFRKQGTWQVPTLKGWDFDLRGDSGLTIPADAYGLVPEPQRTEWRQTLESGADRSAEQRQLALDEFLRFQQLTTAMKKAGVGILAGTDTPHTLVVPGLALHQELQLLVDSGLSPAEALAIATIEAARFLELDQERGRIAPEMAADLVIVDDNPLEDIRNTQSIAYVLRDGRLYDRQRLHDLLDEARAAYAVARD